MNAPLSHAALSSVQAADLGPVLALAAAALAFSKVSASPPHITVSAPLTAPAWPPKARAAWR